MIIDLHIPINKNIDLNIYIHVTITLLHLIVRKLNGKFSFSHVITHEMNQNKHIYTM